MDKQNEAAYSCNGILSSNKRKAHAICYKIKKPDIKDYVWYNTIHMKSPEMENLWR